LERVIRVIRGGLVRARAAVVLEGPKRTIGDSRDTHSRILKNA
jgi:hypothetical protein